MKLNVKYFGQVAEATGLDFEVVEIEERISTEDLSALLSNRYELDNTLFRIAVNQQLANQSMVLSDNDEIALLPPFAGG